MKITFAQFQRYERLLKEQEEERGHHALVDSNVYENCVQGVIMHEREVEPSYASVLKQGRKRAPPASRYAAAATAPGGILATTKAPPKKKRAPPKKITTMDPNKLYLDSAATYHVMFFRWYLKNVRDAGRILRGNCNAGVRESLQVGDLGIFKMWLYEGGIANLLSIP